MAERKIDHFARNLGAAVDRRGVLRGATGCFVAAVFAWRTGPSGLAQATSLAACTTDDDCSGDGLDPCLGGMCLNGVCETFVADCLPGDYCCGNGVCCPGTEIIECFADSDCASASDDPCVTTLCDAGLCATLIVDCAPGYRCCGNGECCVAESDACLSSADCEELPGPANNVEAWPRTTCWPGPVGCPPGSTCQDGVCVPHGNESQAPM